MIHLYLVLALGETSKVSKATTNSISLRTTIPEHIAVSLGIHVGDVLDWTVEERGEKKVAVVRRLQ